MQYVHTSIDHDPPLTRSLAAQPTHAVCCDPSVGTPDIGTATARHLLSTSTSYTSSQRRGRTPSRRDRDLHRCVCRLLCLRSVLLLLAVVHASPVQRHAAHTGHVGSLDTTVRLNSVELDLLGLQGREGGGGRGASVTLERNWGRRHMACSAPYTHPLALAQEAEAAALDGGLVDED